MHDTSTHPSMCAVTSNHGPSSTEQARTSNRIPPPINHHSNKRAYTATNAQNNWSHGEDKGTTRGALHGNSKGGKPHESVVAPLAYGEQAEVGVHSEVSLTLSTIRRYQASKGGHEQPAMLCERVCLNPNNGRLQHQQRTIRATKQRLQNLVCMLRTSTMAQPATIIPKEFAVKAHSFVLP